MVSQVQIEEIFTMLMEGLTPEQRLSVIEAIAKQFCVDCGRRNVNNNYDCCVCDDPLAEDRERLDA